MYKCQILSTFNVCAIFGTVFSYTLRTFMNHSCVIELVGVALPYYFRPPFLKILVMSLVCIAISKLSWDWVIKFCSI